MFIPFPLSSAVLAALLAIGAYGSLAPIHRLPMGAEDSVDRPRKGDRLLVAPVDLVWTTTVIPKNVDAQQHATRGENDAAAWSRNVESDDVKRVPKLTPAPLIDCDTVASLASDPILSRLIGRCFA